LLGRRWESLGSGAGGGYSTTRLVMPLAAAIWSVIVVCHE
jgi:hypothetical protein